MTDTKNDVHECACGCVVTFSRDGRYVDIVHRSCPDLDYAAEKARLNPYPEQYISGYEVGDAIEEHVSDNR